MLSNGGTPAVGDAAAPGVGSYDTAWPSALTDLTSRFFDPESRRTAG
jgi:hypothetical protein